MSIQTVDLLEQVIRQARQAWIIDSHPSRAQALASLHALLAQADAHAKCRLGPAAPQISAASLAAELGHNPHRVQAFLQALRSAGSPEMLVMAWRILQGMEIAEIALDYHVRESFRLHVRLCSPRGGPDDVYDSTDIDDAALIRHFGIMKIDDAPVFDGFYGLGLTDPNPD